MENNKLFSLFHNINESKLNILTRKFTLQAFQALFPYIIKCRQLNIFISDNSLFINKNVNQEKRNYMINYNQINMLNVDAELKLKNDLMNKYYAIQFCKMINEKIFIKSSKNDNSQIHFSFSLIDKPEKIYLNNTDEISAASLGIVKSNDKFRFTTSKEVDDYNDALEEFQAIWNDSFSFDVSDKYIDKLNSIYRDFSPADIYYFNLYHIFNKNLEEYQGDKASNVTEWKNTIIYKSLYDFQTIEFME